MNNKVTHFNSVSLFILASFISLVFSFLWMFLGDSWEISGDALHYMDLYNNQIAKSPFGYRILTPYLASLLPWDAITNFTIVTLTSLSFASGAILLYAKKLGTPKLNIIFIFVLWATSYPFIYYGTTFVRADSPIFFLIALTILLSKYHTSAIVLLVLLAIGTLFHEMVMVVIPMLWLDRLFLGSLSGGKKYNYRQLLLITFGTLSFYMITKIIIPTNPNTSMSYLNSPIAMFTHILDYTGGSIKHILRIYASFGPVMLFSIFYILFINKKVSDILVYFGLFFIVAAATFLAADTLRVMAIFYFPIIIYGSYFLISIWVKGHYITTILLILLQVSYTFIVYLNLRTFESSILWNVIAGGISLITLLLCFFEIRKKSKDIYEISHI